MDIAVNAGDEGLWDVQKVAELLGLRPYTIRCWARTGRIPAIRLGRSIRFVPARVREWLKRFGR